MIVFTIELNALDSTNTWPWWLLRYDITIYVFFCHSYAVGDVNKNAISMGRIASAAIVMPRERFVYLRIYDIFAQEIWIHASVEAGRNIWRTGEEIDRASSLTLFLFPSLFLRSTPLRRCTANVVELSRGAFFAHHRAPSRPLFPLHPNYLSITGFYFFPVAVGCRSIL